MKKIIIIVCAINLFVLIAGIAFAIVVPDYAADDANAKNHSNITAAQKLLKKAYSKLLAAQKANEFDAAGHAQKAKDLLGQVKAELKLAAQAIDANAQGK